MKYITITYKSNDPRTDKSVWNGYAENVKQAKAELYADPLNGGVKEILSITEQGFDLGDRVVVEDHYIIDDEPGVVIAYAHDGYIIVEWKQFDFAEEFHWSELKKVIE